MDENVTLARYAERAERFDDMTNFMKKRAQTNVPLDAEERDMLSAAFKQALQARRQATRIAHSSEAQAENAQHAQLSAGYRSKVEAELTQLCEDATTLLKEVLIPGANGDEVAVFYLKMTGDYYRYMAEVATETKKAQLAAEATQYYGQGLNAAQALAPTHPTRLGLALNYSVFLHEVAGQTQEAITTATDAFNNGVQQLNNVTDPNARSEAEMTLQLLQDNLTIWSSGA